MVGKTPNGLDGSLHEKLPYDSCDNLKVKDSNEDIQVYSIKGVDKI